jgi:hypothetical protein
MKTVQFRAAVVLLALPALLCGCATVSSIFGHGAPDYSNVPADALKKVAQEVEKAVKEGNREPVLADQGGLKLDVPEIKQAVRTRAARAALVSKLLSSGFAIEQKDGLIAILRGRDYKKATTSDERDRDALVVMSENANRWTIYEGIVRQSNLGGKALSTVQDAFYKARVELMLSGQKYQDDAGKTVVKP